MQAEKVLPRIALVCINKYDHSVFEAFSRVVRRQLIPQLSTDVGEPFGCAVSSLLVYSLMLQVNLLDYVHAYRVGLILKISNEKKSQFLSPESSRVSPESERFLARTTYLHQVRFPPIHQSRHKTQNTKQKHNK